MIALPVAFSATASFASTAANTGIVNNAVLTYNGGLTATSQVTVQVLLVPTTPNVTINNATGFYLGVDTQTLSDTVTVTATANGPSNYTITPSVTASSNTTGASVAGLATIPLGATITAGTGTATTMVVPYSLLNGSTAPNSPVNGIGLGNIIVFTINGNTYSPKVTATTYNASPLGIFNTVTITFDTPISGADVAGNVAGLQVGQRQSVTLSAKPGTITLLGNDLTTTVNALVSAPGLNPLSGAAPFYGTATTSPANKWTSTPPTITFQKYSRNITNPVVGTGTPHTNASIEGNTGAGSLAYYTGGVTGKTGDVIEYVVEASNASTSTFDLTTCAISDTIPTAYVTDLLTPYSGTKPIFYIDTTGTTFDISAVTPATSQASYASPNLNVFVGVGANNSTPGTIPIGKTATIAYQVKIK